MNKQQAAAQMDKHDLFTEQLADLASNVVGRTCRIKNTNRTGVVEELVYPKRGVISLQKVYLVIKESDDTTVKLQMEDIDIDQ